MKIGETLGDLPIPARFPGVTKLKEEYRAFLVDLNTCEDSDTLQCLLMTSKPLLARIEAELADWWHGDLEPDQGLGYLIELRRKELGDRS